MSGLPVEPVEVPGVMLASINSVWGPDMHRHTYETDPPQLDKKARRIGWHVYFRELPGPDGTRFQAHVRHLRNGDNYGPGSMPSDPMTYAEIRAYVAQLLAASLKRYKKLDAKRAAAKAAPRATFEPYDVLQVSRDNELTWLDFSTLRDRADFENAVRIVLTDGRCSGFSGFFRVRKGSPCSPGPDVKFHKSSPNVPVLPPL